MYLLFYILGLLTPLITITIFGIICQFINWLQDKKDEREYNKQYKILTVQWDSFSDEIKNKYLKEMAHFGFDDEYLPDRERYFRFIYFTK